jgi:hypothetical protein
MQEANTRVINAVSWSLILAKFSSTSFQKSKSPDDASVKVKLKAAKECFGKDIDKYKMPSRSSVQFK